jgi:serine protease Do
MNTWIKASALLIAGAAITSSAMSQDNRTPKQSGKNQQIIINRDGDKSEKTTIVLDGDNVTINGKPLSEYKGDDVRVITRNGVTSFGPRASIATTPRGGYQLFDGERSNKAMLGVMTEKAADGARITDVTQGSAAEKAGLKKDDIIVKAGDKKISGADDLVSAIGGYKPQDKVELIYKRNGRESKTTATLGENKGARVWSSDDFHFKMPELNQLQGFGENFIWRKPKIGLQIQDVEEGKGVKVKDVDEDSPAAKAGLKEGDVISSVNGKEVAGVDDLRNEIKDIKEGDSIKFSYRRNGSSQTAEVKLPKKLKTADL